MTPEHLVSQIRRHTIDQILKEYSTYLEEIEPGDVTYKIWKDAIILYRNLEPEQRLVLLKLIRQGLVDNTSSLLAIFDGASYIDGQEDDLEVFYSETSQKISGDLQSIFLVQEELDSE